jgi:transposase
MMFGLDISTKVFLYGKPCDMRKGFNGLFGLVQNEMDLNPLSGYIFVFISKDRNKVKQLYWDKDGLVLYYKRLEKGTFKRPSANVNAPNNEFTHEYIYMILRGIDFDKTKKRKRYLTT